VPAAARLQAQTPRVPHKLPVASSGFSAAKVIAEAAPKAVEPRELLSFFDAPASQEENFAWSPTGFGLIVNIVEIDGMTSQ
jgi:hypothetical protein